MAKAPKTKKPAGKTADSYLHQTDTVPMRPEIGTQANFRKKKAPRTYRYDSSLSPVLEWDGTAGREMGEWLLGVVERASLLDAPHVLAKPEEFKDGGGVTVLSVSSLQEAVDALKRLSKPFLNWAGKAERLSFDVPTLPLFVHERLSTQKIVKTLVGHKTDKQVDLFDLFGDPHRSIVDQTLHAYEYPDKWVNRLILGDSLVVMNSLLHYEGLGGQVQMIYIDPPYGVKFGSNFQPFVRKRDVSHNDDEDLTREPEMVKAYRDTWELGLHSYLTYMRDRLLLARELLTPSGSVFVQISDENLHHVRELMDEVFGAENSVSVISFKKTTTASGELLSAVSDYLLWYARDKERLKFRQVFLAKDTEPDAVYKYVRLPSGEERTLTPQEMEQPDRLPTGSRLFALDNLTSQRPAQGDDVRAFTFKGREFVLQKGTFKTDAKGLTNLESADRLGVSGSTLRYKRFLDDFPAKSATNLWTDTSTGSFTESKVYVVQTSTKAIQRCIAMAR